MSGSSSPLRLQSWFPPSFAWTTEPGLFCIDAPAVYQRAFILPTRDPVRTGVFKTFLHHVGIDKATYVRQVRPNL